MYCNLDDLWYDEESVQIKQLQAQVDDWNMLEFPWMPELPEMSIEARKVVDLQRCRVQYYCEKCLPIGDGSMCSVEAITSMTDYNDDWCECSSMIHFIWEILDMTCLPCFFQIEAERYGRLTELHVPSYARDKDTGSIWRTHARTVRATNKLDRFYTG